MPRPLCHPTILESRVQNRSHKPIHPGAECNLTSRVPCRELEAHQGEINDRLAADPADIPDIHPNIG